MNDATALALSALASRPGTDHGFRGATAEQTRQLDEATDAFLRNLLTAGR